MIASNSLSAFSASATASLAAASPAVGRAGGPVQPARATGGTAPTGTTTPLNTLQAKPGQLPSPNLPRGSLLDLRV